MVRLIYRIVQLFDGHSVSASVFAANWGEGSYRAMVRYFVQQRFFGRGRVIAFLGRDWG